MAELETQGTVVEISTGTGSAVGTVTAAVGNPTIITKAAHGLTEGQVVAASLFDGASAALLNGNKYICKFVTTNTLALDVDTTGGTLTAANGTLTPETYTVVGEITGWSITEGTRSERDLTDLADTEKKFKVSPVIERGQATLDLKWSHTDTGFLAVLASLAAGNEKSYRFTYADTTPETVYGQVLSAEKTGSGEEIVTGTMTLRIQDTATT